MAPKLGFPETDTVLMPTKYQREDSQAVIVATAAVSVLAALFMYPLPPSPTFFDGLGRIALIYVVGAVLIALFMAPQSRSFRNIVQGTLAVAFFGTIGGLLLEGLLKLLGF